MIEVQQECGKPLLMVTIPGHDLNLGQQFCQAGIPFFESAERAMGTYALVFRYQRWRRLRVSSTKQSPGAEHLMRGHLQH